MPRKGRSYLSKLSQFRGPPLAPNTGIDDARQKEPWGATLAIRSRAWEQHVRRLADQSAQERKAHTEWASTLVEQQQQMGAHVTTLTNEYEGLLKNVNRIIDASNSVTRELETLIR